MTEISNTEDCYYFLYSTCKRGESCLYRHNLLCKQCNVLCEEWKNTKECREDCPLRHSFYHLKKNRSNEYCHWESKGGCKKEFCEFKHMEAGKDEWKTGKVKELTEIIKEKNEEGKKEEITVDIEEFEKERKMKRDLKTKGKKSQKMIENIKNALKDFNEEQKEEFDRILKEIEAKKIKKNEVITNNKIIDSNKEDLKMQLEVNEEEMQLEVKEEESNINKEDLKMQLEVKEEEMQIDVMEEEEMQINDEEKQIDDIDKELKELEDLLN
ncbi:leucyl-tRNA synthetase [Nucleospora cyclopteri]